MTKLYHNGQLEGWQLPGEQDKGAHRIDVPNVPAELATWLNLRRVGPTGAAAEQERRDEQLSGAPGSAADFRLGPPTKEPPRVSPAFLGDLESGAVFVPITKAAEIDRLLERCPKCSGGATGRVLDWVRGAGFDELQLVAERIKARCVEMREQLDGEGSVQ